MLTFPSEPSLTTTMLGWVVQQAKLTVESRGCATSLGRTVAWLGDEVLVAVTFRATAVRPVEGAGLRPSTDSVSVWPPLTLPIEAVPFPERVSSSRVGVTAV